MLNMSQIQLFRLSLLVRPVADDRGHFAASLEAVVVQSSDALIDLPPGGLAFPLQPN